MRKLVEFKQRRLEKLQSRRKKLANQIDESYLREDIDVFLSLERKHRRMQRKINAIKSHTYAI